MKKLYKILLYTVVLLTHLATVGCNKYSYTSKATTETNKLEKIVLKEEIKEQLIPKKTKVLNSEATYQNDKPVHEAAADGDISAVMKYLDSGIQLSSNYDIKKTYGGNPLFSAVFNGHNDIVKLLISKGADINSTDINGETPLDWAISKNLIETDILLRKLGGKTSKELKNKSLR
ncbi:MAG: hypothetical protein CMO77_02875 [Verrucomicrobiales bacterium]|nr:hypothetical protein [Verrucomicrobiales bacterium]